MSNLRTYHPVVDALLSKLGEPNIVSGDTEFIWCCPFCFDKIGREDVKYHLYVNPTKGKFMCHRCETKGTVDYLLRRLGIRDIKQISLSLDDIWELLTEVGSTASAPPDYSQLVYPVPTMRIREGMISYDYLVNERGYEPSVIKMYKLRVGTSWLKHRIFIPTHMQGKRVFFVARTINGEEPKYLNPKERYRRNYLFNYDQAIGYETVVVTEGVFSSLAVGENAVAAFGKYVTPEQIKLLLKMNAKEYIIALDEDAQENAVRCASLLSARGARVRIAELPKGEDPDSISQDELQRVLDAAYSYTHFGVMEKALEGLMF